jgi:UDP-3-O-acyl-N-acetylglucosamine deacetylase
LGLKVDPFTNGLPETHSGFSVRPSGKEGVQFVIDDREIPYNPQTLQAIDGIFGRMLRVSDAESKVQILIVEHLLSAIRLLGLSGIEIHLAESCRAPLMSSGIPKI